MSQPEKDDTSDEPFWPLRHSFKPASFWQIEGTKKEETFSLIKAFRPLYSAHFGGADHESFYCYTEDAGPCIFSITKSPTTDGLYTILIRRTFGTTIYSINDETKGAMNSFRRLFGMTPNPIDLAKLAIPSFPYGRSTKLNVDGIQEQLSIFEAIEERAYKQMKVGVLFNNVGQQHETDMFSNKDGSPEFDQFLNFIGSRVQLSGFDGYAGDLDVSDKHLDGPFSVYTQIAVQSNNGHKCECMYHVSTLLNYMPNNKQQIDRKRYIGNDNVVIVFQQPGCEPYKCDTIISEPNHAIISVTPIKKQEALNMIKNRTEQLKILHLIKEQKKKDKQIAGEQETEEDQNAGAGIGIEIEGTEDVFMRRKPRGPPDDNEPQVDGDQPESDVLVTYRSTMSQQQGTSSSSSSSSSENSPSPVPIFDEDLTYRSVSGAKSSDNEVDESANIVENENEIYYLVSVAYKSGIVSPYLPRLRNPPIYRSSSESDRNSFLQKLFAVEQSTWIAPPNKIRFEGMRRQEMLRIVKKLGIGQDGESSGCCC